VGKQKCGIYEQGGSAAKRIRGENDGGDFVSLFEPMPRVVTNSEGVLCGSDSHSTEDTATKLDDDCIHLNQGTRKVKGGPSQTSNKENSKARGRKPKAMEGTIAVSVRPRRSTANKR